MRFQLCQLHIKRVIGLKSGKKSINLVSVWHFRELKVTLKLKLQILNFFTDKDYMHKLYLLQSQTYQIYHFQATVPNIVEP